MNTIENKIIKIKKRIADYELKYHRESHSVSLLAVSKKQSIEKIEAAYQAGQTCFGENYLQEALDKIFLLTNPEIEWHFIGTIQTNKTRKIAENFAWVHCVTSMKIAKRLSDQRPLHLPPLNICIEVNVSHEASKSGVEMHELNELIHYCLTLPRLKLRGLMAIPAHQNDFQLQRDAFHQLYSQWKMFRDQGVLLDTLSMGMSDDFEAAIAEGSTLVRIGTSIFGERD